MIKRSMDIFISGIALIFLLPILPPIALILSLTGEGEIFYVQPRIGKDGKEFGLIKFATMLKDSPNMPGGDVTIYNDPRILPFGRILRKSKINELPQLWNVLKGDMSIVGPRPLVPSTFFRYPIEIKEETNNLQPGLTGIGSIVFRDEELMLNNSCKSPEQFYFDDILPYKGRLEIWYKKNQSIWLDLKLIFFTAWAILVPNSKLYEKAFKGIPERPLNLRYG